MTILLEKIQKVLARTGFASRREVERWIAAGRITVDGTVATLGDRISAENKVCLDGQAMLLSWEGQQQRILAYYKPEGEICSRNDPEHKNTIFDHLPNLYMGRWISVGRLDINTTGLILLTNDGELANRLMHPSHEIEREYAARILGDVSDEMINNLLKGVSLDDGVAKFNKVWFSGGEGANRWYHVTLKEGRNREVRRLWESQGLKVSRLSRVKFGNIHLRRGQKQGRFADLEEAEIKELYKSVGLEYSPKLVSGGRKPARTVSRERGEKAQKNWDPTSVKRKNLVTPQGMRKKKRR